MTSIDTYKDISDKKKIPDQEPLDETGALIKTLDVMDFTASLCHKNGQVREEEGIQWIDLEIVEE